jgi:hypothetical protein
VATRRTTFSAANQAGIKQGKKTSGALDSGEGAELKEDQ